MKDDEILVKLDFSSPFNRIRRAVMLKTVAEETPELYRFRLLSYGNPPILKCGCHTFLSSEGVQQGDPLGTLLCCITLQPLLKSMKSAPEVGFMDDVTIGGQRALVKDYDTSVIYNGKELGLFLNIDKCELISTKNAKNTGNEQFQDSFPG